MNHKLIALGLASTLALGACGGDKTTTLDNAGMASPAPTENLDSGMDSGNAMMSNVAATPAQAFANTAGASDAFEIAAGKLAQDKATNPKLKTFGAMMVTGHTESTAKLKAVGAKASPAIVPDPTLTAEQESNLATLRSATGDDFDNAYKTQQIAAHQAALSAMKDYAANGDVAALKTFASDTSKVVQMHLDKLNAM